MLNVRLVKYTIVGAGKFSVQPRKEWPRPWNTYYSTYLAWNLTTFGTLLQVYLTLKKILKNLHKRKWVFLSWTENFSMPSVN